MCSTTTTTTAGSDGSSSGGPSFCGRGRQTVERPDDTDLPQVHAIYVLASDSVDDELDLDGSIAGSLLGVTAWTMQASGGRALRLDTCDGDVVVTFVQLDRTEADLAETGIFLRDELEAELTALGFDGFAGNGKL